MSVNKPSGAQSVPIDLSNPDIWDDTLLVKAYDDALKITKEEVARRLASLTNKPEKGSVTETSDDEEDSEQKGNQTTKIYKLGHHVRATYDVDGVDYEGKIIEVQDDGDCYVEFIGYGNEQLVAMSDLLPSWGRKARKRQIKAAAEQFGVNEDLQLASEVSSSAGGERTRRQQRTKTVNRVGFNQRDAGMANLVIPPPPPMPPMLCDSTEDAEHLSAMLMSWYMSGYYTGLYQGQKLTKVPSKPKSKRNK